MKQTTKNKRRPPPPPPPEQDTHPEAYGGPLLLLKYPFTYDSKNKHQHHFKKTEKDVCDVGTFPGLFFFTFFRCFSGKRAESSKSRRKDLSPSRLKQTY